MDNSKKSMWLDLVFMLGGLITLLLLFMPVQYIEYRYAGYVGVAVFLTFLTVREIKRKRRKPEESKQENQDGVEVVDFGVIEYEKAWDEQRQRFDDLMKAKLAGEPEHPTLLLCEHPHVYTLGKSGVEGNLLVDDDFLRSINATYFKTDRGGDITYHGYGQLVGYPILDLDVLGMGLKEYIHALEESVIRTVAEYGIESGRLDGATGVWLESDTERARKICAIGVKASRFVTMHGFALNVNTDLKYFSYINPCGFVDKGVTSLKQELGREVDFNEVKEIYKKHFSECIVNASK